jgi:diadenosine tetraphosphate (Ap4A) HIT family hydrolase
MTLMMARGQNKEGLGLLSGACDFCDEFRGGRENAFARLYGKRAPERILLATGQLCVVASLGQIVEGYLLVLPMQHYRALADAPHGFNEELADLKNSVRAVLSAAYGRCVFFEHGTRSENSGGCGIYHAHLHAVPLVQRTDPIVRLKQRFALKGISGIEKIGETIDPIDSYLYYQDLDSREYVCPVDHLPSQYMRRLLAETLGRPNWDWRECHQEGALLSTIARLTPCFRSQALPTFSRTKSEPSDAATAH